MQLPGGQEASKYIVPYDLVPANCEVYEQIVAALRQYDTNVTKGGDRTSLRFEGAPLELESVIADATGEDVTDQVSNQDFHLVTAVEQLTGQSVRQLRHHAIGDSAPRSVQRRYSRGPMPSSRWKARFMRVLLPKPHCAASTFTGERLVESSARACSTRMRSSSLAGVAFELLLAMPVERAH